MGKLKVNIIISICLFIPFLIMGQNQSSKFKHLTSENGLSQSTITCILKDSRGFMWFGTEDGLNKYDGTSFIVYRHMPDDSESLSSSYITSIVEQEDGFLWIGTKNGLNYFNPNNEKFKQYLHDPNDTKSLGHNEINTLQISNDGRLLIGTPNGLNLFDPDTGFSKYTSVNTKNSYNVISMVQDKERYLWVLSSEMLERIKIDNGSFSKVQFQKSFKSSFKYTMLLDSLNLWIGTDNGLVRFDLRTEASNIYRFSGLNKSKNKRNNILSIINGQLGSLWLGTNGGGLIHFDKITGQFKTILHDPYNRLSLNSNSIKSMFLDESEILWLGTYGGGINKYDPDQFKFKHYKYLPGDRNSLSENTVRSILVDRDGELWVGTHGGLNRINRKTNRIKTYKYDQNNLTAISSNMVRALCEDSKGIIWAGTWGSGLNSFNKRTGIFKRYISLPTRADSIGQVRVLKADNQGNIWVGGNGLWRFNPLTNKYKSYFYDENNNNNNNNNLSINSINTLHFSKSGLLWVGTSQNGLNSLNMNSNIIKEYLHDPKDTLSISHKHVTSIAEDRKGSLWVGTYGGGLNVLDISNGIFQHYNTSNGLLNDVIYGILIDSKDFIWFTSNAGLGRFDPNTKEFKYFGVEHGIQSDEFNAGAYFKSTEGEFFFGGINGFNAFYPNAINSNKKTSKIIFTDFQLLDEKRTFTVNKILDKHISRAEHIKLKHNQNTFSLKFAELNYSENVDNSYEYQLDGFEKDWQYLGKKQTITLGNLNPGVYTLNVRVHNDLTKKTTINITISPPFWKSNWAYTAYVLTIILITSLIYRNVMKIKRIRRQFELKIRNWENDTNTQAKLSNTTLSLKKVQITSTNQRFLERTIKIVENNIEDSSFDVEKFASEMFMSRSQLHRKLKALTGYSTTEFIRMIRLKRAAQLLQGNSGTVSEIAYKVGFDNIGYFSKCFRETFGKPPSQYTM